MRQHLTPAKKAIIKKPTNTKCWRWGGQKGTLLDYWWDCKLVQPLWRTVCVSCSVMSDSFRPHGLWPARLLCMGFSRQEYWNGLPFPSPEDLPDPGIGLGSPALQADSLP